MRSRPRAASVFGAMVRTFFCVAGATHRTLFPLSWQAQCFEHIAKGLAGVGPHQMCFQRGGHFLREIPADIHTIVLISPPESNFNICGPANHLTHFHFKDNLALLHGENPYLSQPAHQNTFCMVGFQVTMLGGNRVDAWQPRGSKSN